MIRFAILAGVSKDIQAAEDKRSIPDQIAGCRTFIDKTDGGIETAGPFIMDGYSRTGYDSLEIAMRDIPPLADAVMAAERGRYDVLLLDNFDRLGDIAGNILTRFNRYKKQLYSIRQSGKLYDPEGYDPHDNEFADISIAYERMIQKYRLSKIRRGWKVGVPERIRRGLASARAPIGYSYTYKGRPFEINEDAAIVLKMKDLFLEGRSLAYISREVAGLTDYSLTDRGIKYILKNPFYAGITALFRSQVVEKGKSTRHGRPRDEWVTGQGQHQALWTEQTYDAILDEFDRRMGLKNYSKTRYPLSGLLRCEVCGLKMDRSTNRARPNWKPSLRCRNGHMYLKYDAAILEIAAQVRSHLQDCQLNPPDRSEEMSRIRGLVSQAETRRRRVQAGYESDLYTGQEAADRLLEIDNEIRSLRRQEEAIRASADLYSVITKQLGQMDLDYLGDWIASDDPGRVNQLLSGIIRAVWVSKDKKIRLEFK